MKKIIVIFLILSLRIVAQDTIRFRNGSVEAVKVNEIGLHEIKYNRADNPDGPLYISKKNDVVLIKYKNGHIDSFSVAKSVSPSVLAGSSGVDKIDIRRNKLYYSNSKKGIGEVRLHKIVNLCPDVAKQNKMIPVIQEMKSYKKKQYAIGFSCLGVGVATAYVGFVAAIISEDPSFFIAIPVGAAIGITGAIVSSVMKHKRIAKKLEVARIYNGEQ